MNKSFLGKVKKVNFFTKPKFFIFGQSSFFEAEIELEEKCLPIVAFNLLKIFEKFYLNKEEIINLQGKEDSSGNPYSSIDPQKKELLYLKGEMLAAQESNDDAWESFQVSYLSKFQGFQDIRIVNSILLERSPDLPHFLELTDLAFVAPLKISELRLNFEFYSNDTLSAKLASAPVVTEGIHLNVNEGKFLVKAWSDKTGKKKMPLKNKEFYPEFDDFIEFLVGKNIEALLI